MPLCQKLGGNNNGAENCRNGTGNGSYLTPQQTSFIYKKVELGSLIDKETIREELDSEAELDKIDDNSRDEKPV